MRRTASSWAAVLVAATLLTACGSDADPGPSGSGTAVPSDSEDGDPAVEAPTGPITFVSGFDPGGGIDLAINSMIPALEATGAVGQTMRLTNIPGGSGLIAAATLVADNAGDSDIMQVATLSSMAATVRQGDDEVGLLDLTPIAGLFSEFTYVYVRADSEFEDFAGLVEAIEADPTAVRISGGSLGSADSLTVAALGQVLGLDFAEMTYIPLEGGEGTTGILGGQVETHFGGPDLLSLVESGDLRVLAVSAPERLSAEAVADIPTIVESGYDVVQANWRGLMGPPDMPAGAVAFWEQAIADMVETDEWQESMAANIWENTYLDSADFTDFLADQKVELTATLSSLGLVE